jgi:hypothetical protein
VPEIILAINLVKLIINLFPVFSGNKFKKSVETVYRVAINGKKPRSKKCEKKAKNKVKEMEKEAEENKEVEKESCEIKL